MRIETCAGSWLIGAAGGCRGGHVIVPPLRGAFHSLLVGDGRAAGARRAGRSALSGWLHADAAALRSGRPQLSRSDTVVERDPSAPGPWDRPP